MSRKKKSLVGWCISCHDLRWYPEFFGCFIAMHEKIYPNKQMCDKWMHLPDGKYKSVKVRITLEEL
jgi:hypothetical protein